MREKKYFIKLLAIRNYGWASPLTTTNTLTMKTFKLHLILMLVLSACIVYSCDSISDSTPQQSEIQSQELLQSSEAKDKVPVCHVDGQGNYSLITVAEPALKGHEKHGDAQPGDAVPDMEGYVFDDTCTPQLSDGVEITACFIRAFEKLEADPSYRNDIVIEDLTGWELDDDDPNDFVIITRISEGYFDLRTRFGSSEILQYCEISYPLEGPYAIGISSGLNADEHSDNIEYLEYLLNL